MSIKIETLKTYSFEMDHFKFGFGSRNMVIIPGLSIKSVMESADFIAEAYSLFAEKYTVYVFDIPKHLPAGCSIHDMARDTAVALDALGIKDAYFFGISMGGMISQVIAAERPDLVHKLLLGSSCSKLTDEEKKKLLEWVSLAENKRVTELSLAFAEAVYTKELFEKNRKAFAYLAEITTDEELAQFITAAKAVSVFDITQKLYKIQCPVLLMAGGQDKIMSRSSFELLAEKTHGELYIYEDYPHSVYDEAPDFKQRTFDFYEKD